MPLSRAPERPPPRPRRVPPAQALPEPQIGAAQALGAGAAAGTLTALAGTAAGVAATAPAAPLLKLHQESVEKIIEALRTFFVVARARQQRWLLDRFRARLPQDDILTLVAEETARQAEFERRVIARVRRDSTVAFRLPEKERRKKLDGLIRREQVYARQRSEAMAVRSLAALDRAVLRRESPGGAYWRLDPNLRNHTPDCVAMAGKAWPWVVLDDFHPPTHSGCGCALHAVKVARSQGWLRGNVLPLDVARRRASAARALLHESDEMWEAARAALRAGLVFPEALVDRMLDAG